MKQLKVDEALRENNRLKLRLRNFKCPMCQNQRQPPKEEPKKDMKKPVPVKKPKPKRKYSSSEDEMTEEELSKLKKVERGRQGFSPLELG